MRGADLLVETLKTAGVQRIFSLSGNQIMPVYDACLGAGIEIVHTRHEGAAVFMAEAHAQVTGEVGVALVTAGAGLGNAIGPLLCARESDTPVLLLSGDSPVAQDGHGAFQEMDQTALTASLTKLSVRPVRADDLGTATARAMRVAASGRPGPVHLALPFDVLSAETDAPVPTTARDMMALSPEAIDAIAAEMAAAVRPVILTGPVLSETRAPGLARQLTDAFGASVLCMESPRGLRDPALGGFGAKLAEADTILCLGKRIDFTLGAGAAFAADARIHLVTPDEAERARAHLNLGGRVTTHVADPRDAVSSLVAAATARAPADWQATLDASIAARADAPGADGLTPDLICAAVQRRIDAHPDTIVICDGGEFGQWAQAYTSAPRRIVNGISGAIGGGPCYGLATALAQPDAQVIVMVGDGTVGFHFAEFETAARAGAAFTVVIGNDRRWNAEHVIQMRDFGLDRGIGCDLSGARYDEAVAALGGHGEHVTEAGDLDAALERAARSGKVACINVAMHGLPAPAAP